MLDAVAEREAAKSGYLQRRRREIGSRYSFFFFHFLRTEEAQLAGVNTAR